MTAIADYYDWIKALHVISVIFWMAGMLYLPRLYVYHSSAKIGSDSDKMLQIMEYRLLKYIMNPTMVLVIITGLTVAHIYGFSALGLWFYIKMLAVLCLLAYHGFLARCRKNFAKGINHYSTRFYKIINEIPAVIIIVIVIMVIVKPFE